MRPIRLELHGFTAFRDPQVVDFDGVDLFTFWGPTGSGKSSLLDAITYALYGKVDRVESVGALVSQGQPRMSVLFEFELENERYRVARSNPRNGGGKARLERHDGTEWRSLGEGADRIRGVNSALIELLGLDYRAFTRSVLLPQGKFAEFLVGDAADRRKILNELLGLELFSSMARLAGEAAREAKANAGATEDLIAREFADVDEALLAAADTDAARAQDQVAAAHKVDDRLKSLAKRHDRVAATADSLVECADDLEGLGRALAKHSEKLGNIATQIGEARRATDAARSGRRLAQTAQTKAAETRERIQQRLGSIEVLAGWREAAGRLEGLRRRLDAERKDATTAAARLDKSRTTVENARAQRAKAEATAADAKHALAEREAIYARAHRDDLVGALTKDLGVGDDCPVCDRPLETIKRVTPAALRTAERQAEVARDRAVAADEELQKARTKAELALQALKTAEEQAARADEVVGATAAELARSAAALQEALGIKEDGDPAAEIERRAAELNRAVAVEDAARSDLERARDRLEEAERRSTALESELRSTASAIAACALEPLLRRTRKVAQDVSLPDALPDPLPDDPDALLQVAGTAAAACVEAADALRHRADSAHVDQRKLIDEGVAAAASVLPEDARLDPSDMERLLDSFAAALRDLEKSAVKAAENATAVRKDLDKRRSLEEEARKMRARQAVYNALALELRGDRIVDYIQSEALCALAAAGSVRLEYLSSHRYRLAYEGDEFFVIDAWNGEERRSVRTLSGGETFLASLGLALALSDEVKTLAVTDKARIDSLFLDEGFGSLDAETLETVVAAIEQLGGDGKLVGVITHVPELAERLPVRFTVTKSPRGSTVALDA